MKRFSILSIMLALFSLLFSCEEPTSPVTGITLNSESLSLSEGESFQLTAIVYPSNATDKTLVWSSSDATVASVVDGLVTAVKKGTATITAMSKDGRAKATCSVSISLKGIPVESVTLDYTEAYVHVGDTLHLHAVVMPDDATNKTITWRCSDEHVATVDQSGCVKAITSGAVRIMASTEDNQEAICWLYVSIPATNVTIIDENIEIVKGHSVTLSLTTEPKEALANNKVIWESSDTTIASVNNGVVYALSKGLATITALIDGHTASCTVKCVLPPNERDREALISLYNSTNGPQWRDIYGNGWNVSENWCTDADISTWRGVECENGRVVGLNLAGSNLVGILPEELGDLTELRELFLQNNLLEGPLPDFISRLEKLEKLVLADNHFKGQIPSFLGSMARLKWLDLQDNYFTGSIPSSIINLKELEDMKLLGNYLSGKIPDEFYDWEFWKSWWGYSIKDNMYNFEELELPGPQFTVTTYDNHVLNSESIYSSHQYTILLQWAPMEYECIINLCDELITIKTRFGDTIDIITWTNSNISEEAESLECWNKMNIPGEFFYWDYANQVNTFGTVPSYPSNYVTTLTIVDNTGKVALAVDYDKNGIITKWFADKPIPDDPGNRYISSDYSKDGTITCIQNSKTNSGPNLVFIGDGYSDRLLDKYDTDVNRACEAFFSEEPYSSYKDYFNIYKITTVSANEVYEDGSTTALSCVYRDGTYITGDNRKCMWYALNAVNDGAQMNKTVIIVLVNRDYYAGTCNMYGEWYGDWGNGLSISYCSAVEDNAVFRGIISHEAGGHGFAKLGDEYWYGTTSIIQLAIDNYLNRIPIGWYKNIDLTNITDEVKWRDFIYDERYTSENLGCYEGGLLYAKGVWRPSENSIMRDNIGGFNAPSRYAIWYRIIKEIYGANAEATYEQFVEYDMKDSVITKRQQAYTQQLLNVRQMTPLAPPTILNYSWKEDYYK